MHFPTAVNQQSDSVSSRRRDGNEISSLLWREREREREKEKENGGDFITHDG